MVDEGVDEARHREYAADDGAGAGEEAGEAELLLRQAHLDGRQVEEEEAPCRPPRLTLISLSSEGSVAVHPSIEMIEPIVARLGLAVPTHLRQLLTPVVL